MLEGSLKREWSLQVVGTLNLADLLRSRGGESRHGEVRFGRVGLAQVTHSGRQPHCALADLPVPSTCWDKSGCGVPSGLHVKALVLHEDGAILTKRRYAPSAGFGARRRTLSLCGRGRWSQQ